MRKTNLDAEQKKLIIRWEAIESGKVKLHHYKSLAAFDRTLD